MKKFVAFFVVVASLGVAASAHAQAAGPKTGTPPTQGSKAGAKIDRKEMQKINEEILAKLNLTDDQKDKLKKHREEMTAKLKDLRKQAKGDPKNEDLRGKIRELQKENAAFLKQTLTKDQMREYTKLRREKLKELRDKQGDKTIKP